MTTAAAWARRSRSAKARAGRSAPNPNVGCVIVSPAGKIVGRGATAPGGRPHAEAIALEQAGKRAKGATVYVTLEPCAHASERGPACTDLLLDGEARARGDRAQGSRPAHRRARASAGCAQAGIEVTLGVGREAAKRSLARLADPARARPSADHAQARAVDRRQDRAALGRNRNGSPARTRAATSISSARTAT